MCVIVCVLCTQNVESAAPYVIPAAAITRVVKHMDERGHHTRAVEVRGERERESVSESEREREALYRPEGATQSGRGCA